MDSDVTKHKSEFDVKLATIQSSSELELLNVEYLGRKGVCNQLFEQMKSLPKETIREFALQANQLKQHVESAIEERSTELQKTEKSNLKIDDVTIPGRKPKIGSLHPTTLVIREINSFFRYYGFSLYEGPEIETNEFNFEKLNLPLDHPARELADTLYIREPDVLLRTHTSSVETRAMTQESMPLRILVPGKVYRNETSNTTNNSVFYQYEGLCIDKGLNMGHLKWTLNAFVKFLYGDVKTRLRCKYYPQVEPGAGMDIQCTFCHGEGCSVCKYRGWIEVLGSGMVHPKVLRACNIDPDEYSGFAFGLGLDRLVMLKYGIDDVRKLYNGELMFQK